MNKLSSALRQQLSMEKQKIPVVKNRTPMWFFKNDIRNKFKTANPIEELQSDGANWVGDTPASKVGRPRKTSKEAVKRKTKKTISFDLIRRIWKNMDSELKRPYYNMAKLDVLRFKDQKSLWVSHVGTALQGHDSIEQMDMSKIDQYLLQKEFLASLDKLQKRYEVLIQTESTMMIYKDELKRAAICQSSIELKDLIAIVPEHHKVLLLKPRRPVSKFFIFLMENMNRLLELKQNTGISAHKLAGIEWNALDEESKQLYEDKYRKAKEEYDEKMEAYKSQCSSSDVEYLQTALLERKAFNRALWKRQRDSSYLPVKLRTAFNFFLMNNKNLKVSDAQKMWRELLPDDREKYEKMAREDEARYYRERKACNEMRKMMDDRLIGGKFQAKLEDS